MRKEVVLVTGANGEVGHGLITHLARSKRNAVVAMDLQPLDPALTPLCDRFIQGDILDTMLLGRLVSEFEIREIFHLASLLSTRAEFTPEAAHRVNVEGTLNLLRLAVEQSHWQGRAVQFIYPSSIAAYGLPSLAAKQAAGCVREDDWSHPTTMYGCNKLYCEHLGRYYSRHYRQLAVEPDTAHVDFRCLRFPGLISAETLPTGGTSDYGPEMLHAAARGESYACFVREDARLPFMAMPDAVKSLLMLSGAPRERLTRLVYNVTSFSLSAGEIYRLVARAFPTAEVTFQPDAKRQAIVDSWPEDIDDSAARADWGWQPDYDAQRAFDEYLVPAVTRRYASEPAR
ncbi:MAG: NAD-dependent epimerase/dehydratase family protein [Anaerolineales bacterium]|nr:NAD-dependent epimerase/dehydratase family protein [Anaerolineales bacterium]